MTERRQGMRDRSMPVVAPISSRAGRHSSSAVKALRSIGLVALLGVSGCHTNKNIAYSPANFGAPDKTPVPLSSADYRLGVGDVVTITVYRVDKFSGEQTIDNAGRISLPLVGSIQAAGKTTGELQRDLTAVLGAKYLASPNVVVDLKTATQRTITVDGSVQQPGVYPIPSTTTLIQSIAMARGTADGADPGHVVVFRRINGQRMAASFNLNRIRKDKAPDPVIYANDVIVVDGSFLSKALKTMLQSLPFVTTFRPL